MIKTIQKDKVNELFSKLEGHDIFVPVKKDGIVTYERFTGEAMAFDLTNSQKPPKDVFFPQTEKMFDLVREGNRFTDVSEPERSSRSMLLFGIRPCDAYAMKVIDPLFSWDYLDPYYLDKRERATTISITCTAPLMPLPNCFCTSVGGSPSGTEGTDILWTDIGDRYLVEPVTDKGNKIIEAGGSVFIDATEADTSAANDAKTKAKDAIKRKLETEGIKEALKNSFESEYWAQFAKRCLGCGICTLLCPTCHCFDINDIVAMGKGWRERTWDSCQYPYYTLHASGHNPRPEKMHRQRNRIYHKFLYMDENLNVLGCVGCGRCITKCPVNIDIIEVIEGIKEVVANE